MKFTANRSKLVHMATWAEVYAARHGAWARVARDYADAGKRTLARLCGRYAREALVDYLGTKEPEAE